MLNAVKSLAVVLLLSFLAFQLLEPLCIRYMTGSDFKRRRNIWLSLTSLAFVSPSFWVFAAIALPLVYWGTLKDRHPTALYALLMVCVPPASFLIPVPFVNQLFSLDMTRILAFALVIPACIRLARNGSVRPLGALPVDLAVVFYGILQVVLFVEYESVTSTLRRAVLFVLDVYVLYFLFSRGTSNKAALQDTLTSWWLAAAIQVPIAAFESVKGWLLYVDIGARWGAPSGRAWITRGDALRVQGPAGHSLTMGFIFAIGFGIWLFLGRRAPSKAVYFGIGAAMCVGLVAALSRAPWLVAAAVFTVYALVSPGDKKQVTKTMLLASVVLALVAVTPYGSKLFSLLPFVGSTEQGNVDYREELAAVSWRVIQEHPWFGSAFALDEMENLRQGEGIIDLVNTFAAIGLFYGGVGVALFGSCFLVPLVQALRAVRYKAGIDVDIDATGAILVAAMVGVLLMMATASFGDAFAITAWAFAGMCVAFPAVKFAEVKRLSPTPGSSSNRFAYSRS